MCTTKPWTNCCHRLHPANSSVLSLFDTKRKRAAAFSTYVYVSRLPWEPIAQRCQTQTRSQTTAHVGLSGNLMFVDKDAEDQQRRAESSNSVLTMKLSSCFLASQTDRTWRVTTAFHTSMHCRPVKQLCSSTLSQPASLCVCRETRVKNAEWPDSAPVHSNNSLKSENLYEEGCVTDVAT